MRIHKYSVEVSDHFQISMPDGAQVLTVQIQRDDPFMWVLVNERATAIERRTFHVYGTGNPLPENVGNFRFIGTFQTHGRGVWHLFEEV